MSDGTIQQVVGPAHSLTSSPLYLSPTTTSITTVLRYRTPDLINIINRIIKPSPSCGHQLQLCRSLKTRPFSSQQPAKLSRISLVHYTGYGKLRVEKILSIKICHRCYRLLCHCHKHINLIQSSSGSLKSPSHALPVVATL